MAPLFDVPRRSAEAADQKIAQPLLGAAQIISWVHGTEDLVARNLSIESRNQPRKPLFANQPEQVGLVHGLRCYCEVRYYRNCAAITNLPSIVGWSAQNCTAAHGH